MSFVGLSLGSYAIYRTYLTEQLAIAELEAKTEAQRGIYFVDFLTEACVDFSDEHRTIRLRVDIDVPKSIGAEFECGKLEPAVNILRDYFYVALYEIVHQGQFYSPKFAMGIPLVAFVGSIDGWLATSTDLTDEQKDVLLGRVRHFMFPYISAIGFIQEKQHDVELSSGLDIASRAWGFFLSFSLALSFVKGTGERKIERQKSGVPSGRVVRMLKSALSVRWLSRVHFSKLASRAEPESARATGKDEESRVDKANMGDDR